MAPRNTRLSREGSVRQDTILLEAINRVRRHAGLREDDLHQRPLTIVVTKWDSWERLLPDVPHSDPYVDSPLLGTSALNGPQVERTSNKVREMLSNLTPEIVAAAEGFAKDLTFIPVSAIGSCPELGQTGALGVRPRNMKPYWVEVPALHAISRFSNGLIPTANAINGKETNR